MGKVKQWKKGGPEDKFIINKIKRGKITGSTKPATLQAEYPNMFGGFSSNVMRNHLNILKFSHGLFLSADGADDDDDIDGLDGNDDQERENAADLCSAELGPESISASSIVHAHQNYPILCNVFKDPENQFQKVIMAVLLPSGAKNARVELSDDGMVAFVKYSWPKTMFSMDDLFKKQLDANHITMHHPKILCVQDALEKVRQRRDLCPESVIKVNLPIKVQTAIDSWTKGGLKRSDGTDIAFAEFKGYIKEYNKTLNDSQLVYDL